MFRNMPQVLESNKETFASPEIKLCEFNPPSNFSLYMIKKSPQSEKKSLFNISHHQDEVKNSPFLKIENDNTAVKIQNKSDKSIFGLAEEKEVLRNVNLMNIDKFKNHKNTLKSTNQISNQSDQSYRHVCEKLKNFLKPEKNLQRLSQANMAIGNALPKIENSNDRRHSDAGIFKKEKNKLKERKRISDLVNDLISIPPNNIKQKKESVLETNCKTEESAELNKKKRNKSVGCFCFF